MDLSFFFKVDRGRIQTFLKEGTNRGTQTQRLNFGQEEEEMKLCLMILSVPWYMLNGLEHTAILSHFLTFIGSSRVSTLHTTF
jgi:hypothetical protein